MPKEQLPGEQRGICSKMLDFPRFGAIIVSNKALKEKQYALRVHEQRRTHAKAG